MAFWEIWLQALILIVILGTFLWGVSVRIKNASIVDIFWGPGFVVCAWWYACLLYTSPSPRDVEESRMPSSA